MLLEVRNLSKNFELREHFYTKKSEFCLFGGVSFSLDAGECLRVAGASGSGKTTLAKIIAKLEPPSGGEIFLDGENYADLRAGRAFFSRVQLLFADAKNSLNPTKKISTLFEDVAHNFGLFGEGVANSNLAQTRAENSAQNSAGNFAENLAQNPAQNSAQNPAASELFANAALGWAVAEYCERLGLAHGVLAKTPREISSGQASKVALICALLVRPRLLVCDEPFAALDVISARAAAAELQRLAGGGTGVIFISHQSEFLRPFGGNLREIWL